MNNSKLFCHFDKPTLSFLFYLYLKLNKDWEDLDAELFTEEEALRRFSQATNLSKEEIDELMEQERKSFFVKQDPAIYKHLLEEHQINPQESVFIDDLAANIAEAEKLGIKGILFDESEDCFEKIRGI